MPLDFENSEQTHFVEENKGHGLLMTPKSVHFIRERQKFPGRGNEARPQTRRNRGKSGACSDLTGEAPAVRKEACVRFREVGPCGGQGFRLCHFESVSRASVTSLPNRGSGCLSYGTSVLLTEMK